MRTVRSGCNTRSSDGNRRQDREQTEELTGKANESVGDATDNPDLEAEGQTDQAKGSLKQAGEKVKDAFKD